MKSRTFHPQMTQMTQRGSARSARHLRHLRHLWILLLLPSSRAHAQQITSADKPARLEVRAVSARALRVSLVPLGAPADALAHPALVERKEAPPALSLTSVSTRVTRKLGALTVDVRANPLAVTVTRAAGDTVQRLVFEPDG